MYKQYAEQLDQLGRAQIQKIVDAAEKTQAANRASENATPSTGEEPLAFKARRAALAAKAEAQRAELKTLSRKIPEETDKMVAELRQKLENAVCADFGAKATDIDHDSLVLLDSGILTGAEYVTMFNSAANPTMKRLVGAAAGRRAEELEKSDPSAAAVLRNVQNAARRCDGSIYLRAFDGMADCIQRTVRNPGMCRHLDRLIEPLMREFD